MASITTLQRKIIRITKDKELYEILQKNTDSQDKFFMYKDRIIDCEVEIEFLEDEIAILRTDIAEAKVLANNSRNVDMKEYIMGGIESYTMLLDDMEEQLEEMEFNESFESITPNF